MEPVIIFFLILLSLKLCAELVLETLNIRSVKSNANKIPTPFKAFIDEATYRKSVEYTLAKSKFAIIEVTFEAILLAIILMSGLLPWLWTALGNDGNSALWWQVASVMFILFLLGLPAIPFSLYGQFRLEERFGFNKMTIGLWLSDRIKGMLITMILAFPLLLAILWVVGLSPWWWLYAFIGIFAFQLIMLVVYPNYIMPLFNKFTELQAGDLRNRLLRLGERTGFTARTILVMDGSKRSAHSNAFFAGFGKLRRIVLYDTLIDQLTPTQLEAVLAHEVGHYKLGHLPKTIAISAVCLFGSFAVMGWLVSSPWFVESFGFQYTSGQLAPILLLYVLLNNLVIFWLAPINNLLSRKHEYEADAFAKRAMGGDYKPLQQALRILTKKNLSNLTPHPLYSAFNYSHPTLVEREDALQKSV